MFIIEPGFRFSFSSGLPVAFSGTVCSMWKCEILHQCFLQVRWAIPCQFFRYVRANMAGALARIAHHCSRLRRACDTFLWRGQVRPHLKNLGSLAVCATPGRSSYFPSGLQVFLQVRSALCGNIRSCARFFFGCVRAIGSVSFSDMLL